MVFALTHAEIQLLYAGLDACHPEPVLARILDGDAVPALCMTLIEPPAPGESNPEYASKLRVVLEKLDFPHDCARSIA